MTRALLLLSLLLASSAAAAKECNGPLVGHCFCQATFDGADSPVQPANASSFNGKELFTYTVTDRCFNQEIDLLASSRDKGCWLACRDAIGVGGHARDPGWAKAASEAMKRLNQAGFCGGVVQGRTLYKVGTNKYRNNTGSDLSLAVGGTVTTVNGKKVCK